MLYATFKVSEEIESRIAEPCPQRSALFCTDCILSFCEFDIATSRTAVDSRMGLADVL